MKAIHQAPGEVPQPPKALKAQNCNREVSAREIEAFRTAEGGASHRMVNVS